MSIEDVWKCKQGTGEVQHYEAHADTKEMEADLGSRLLGSDRCVCLDASELPPVLQQQADTFFCCVHAPL
jgi:hypothetical protein